jgi:glycosyltransferase involved in cell wall biosynthesis
MQAESKTDKNNQLPRLLVVSVAAPPKGAPESLQVSKYLKYLGNHSIKIDLLTEAAGSETIGWTTIESKYAGVLSRLCQVIQIPMTYNRYFSSLIRRMGLSRFLVPDDKLFFTGVTKTVKKQLKVKPDIIYSRSTPFSSAVIAMKLKKEYGVPWIMHLSDPWVISPLFKGHGPVKIIHKRLERECFRYADRITLTSQEQITQYKQRYPEFGKKIVWFPNVYDDEDVVNKPRYHTNRISILHSGNFYGPGRSPIPILKAAQRIWETNPNVLKDISFLFTGHCEPEIDQLIKRYGSLGAKHLGVLSLDETLRLQRKSQVLVVIDWQLDQEYAMFLLSKTVDYMAARKPILAITTPGSTLYNLVEGKYGRCFDHNNIEGIQEYLTKLISQLSSQDYSPLVPYQPDKNYSASFNAKRLFDLIIEVIDNKDFTE